MQTETNLIEDNRRNENHSFLHYLHFIQDQIFKHLVWHFDSQDLYTISDLQSDYWEYLNHMELEMKKLCDRLEPTLEVEN